MSGWSERIVGTIARAWVTVDECRRDPAGDRAVAVRGVQGEYDLVCQSTPVLPQEVLDDMPRSADFFDNLAAHGFSYAWRELVEKTAGWGDPSISPEIKAGKFVFGSLVAVYGPPIVFALFSPVWWDCGSTWLQPKVPSSDVRDIQGKNNR